VQGRREDEDDSEETRTWLGEREDEGNHRNIKPFKQLFCCKVKMTMKSL